MAVLLREKTNIRGKEAEIKVFRPSGSLSRASRERAEKLDALLAQKVPPMAARVMRIPKDRPLKKWYQLGKELHKILKSNSLVSSTDIGNGLIWEAIKQHFPESIGLKGAGVARDAKAGHDGHRGHLAECYAIAEHAWEDVAWIKRWTDWTYIYYRESMWRDRRVLHSMRKEIERMGEYPPQDVLRDILKYLSAQTTGKDIEVLDDSVIAEKVHHAFEQTQPAIT